MKRLLFLVVLGFALHYVWRHHATGEWNAEQIQALAQGVKAEEVVLYGTTECPYCAQARSWLSENGFAYTDCNMSVERRCEQEFSAYGGNGVPYIVIHRRGQTQHMKNGFDSAEFLRLLAKS